MRRARAAARADGVDLQVTSGWRSRAHQRELSRAVATYGSEQAASRRVLPAEQSEHEPGRAVDIGPPAAAAWLQDHGVRYGLCRRDDNEPWHVGLLAPHLGQPCPGREPHAVATLG